MSIENALDKIKYLIHRLNQDINKSLTQWDEGYSDLNITSKANPILDEKLIENWLHKYTQKLSGNDVLKNTVIIFFYVLIMLVSLFGNSIVCKIIFGKSSKKSSTNVYIGNLSISDLMMTVVNIPLQLTQILPRNWPLGLMLCKCLPFFGAMSVSVSTLTMAFIALDRYQVIAHPMKPRLSYKATIRKVILIWIMAFILSCPYPLMSDVISNASNGYATRCTIVYPPPSIRFRQIFTVIALLLQFVVPLAVSGITYVKTCYIIWERQSIGEVTQDQVQQHREKKWKTIKMLVIVLIAFTVCWLPLNVYHTYQDSRGKVGLRKHNTTIWIVCHWFAMSSVCCNPFIYCWLNEKFRNAAKIYLRWILTFGRRKPLESIRCSFVRENSVLTLSKIKNPSLKNSSFSTNTKESSTSSPEREKGNSYQTTSESEDSIRLSKIVVEAVVENYASNQKYSSESSPIPPI
ncbi:probable G-protein coupled receptor 83 [Nephila pilipes]|uniref:Probable G-protein coupled receptor 83 n=1 Tax=Nephila pilipes TaxID=299642 RepID=A0A8X6NDP9_NEPPI|nr:probable G-protein coupled receptor 83 [Nephila pilipes]